MSSEAISTLRLSRWVRRRPSFAVVAVGAERGDQLVMDDLDHHLAGGHRLDHGGADRLLADFFGERAHDVE
jgi:hypothetical protein